MFMLVIPLLLLGICYFNLICRCSRRFSQTTNIQRARCISSPSPSLTTHMHVLRYSPPRLVRGGYREKKFVFRDVPTYQQIDNVDSKSDINFVGHNTAPCVARTPHTLPARHMANNLLKFHELHWDRDTIGFAKSCY